MRDEWGRVETQSWLGDKPVWTYGVLILSVTVACAGLSLRCQAGTPLQQYWLMTYLSASVAPRFRVPVSTYRLMLVLHPNGVTYVPTEQDVAPGLTSTPDGSRIPFVLTEKAERQGKRLILTPPRPWNNRTLERELQEAVYKGQSLMDLARLPLLCGMGLLVFGLPVAILKDKQNAHLCQHGRPLSRSSSTSETVFC